METISKSKNWENGENKRHFSKMKKIEFYRILIAKFQDGSSIGNTQKPRGTMHDVSIFKSTNRKNGKNTRNFLEIKEQKFGF